MSDLPDTPEGHGIDGAVYVLRADGEHHPTLFCVCGYQAGGDSWEEAGADFDEHLANRKKDLTP